MTPEQNKRFKHWQMRTILATMIGYALFYFVRKNFSLAMPGLEADLGISKVSLGIFLTLNGIIYGLSRFVNGILADRMNARWYMAIGLALCALANFAFGFGEDISTWITGEQTGDRFTNTMILFMGIMWMVNGLLQGSGFPPCARLLTHWIPPTELATKMSLWNTSHSIGAGLVVILCGYVMGHLGQNLSANPEAVARIAANLGIAESDPKGMATVMNFAAHFGAWRWCFWIPSAIAFAGAIGLVAFLRDTPTSVGLPELEGTEVDNGSAQGTVDRKGVEYKAFLMKHVFRNPLIWILGAANFFVYVVRFSVLDWGPSLLSQSKGVSMAHAGWLVAMFEIAGILGMLFAGWATDRWLKHLRPAGPHRNRRGQPSHEKGRRNSQRPDRTVRLRFDARFGRGTGIRRPALRVELGLCGDSRHGTGRHGDFPADVGRPGRRLRHGVRRPVALPQSAEREGCDLCC